MAYISSQALKPVNPVARFFSAIFNALVAVSEGLEKVRALNALAEISNDELARRGLTRDGEARRILGLRAAL